LWSIIAFPYALWRDRVEVAHVQYTIPPVAPCPVITSIHDVSFKRYPQFFKSIDRFILDVGVRYAGRRACWIIAVSEHTRREILSLYRVKSDLVSVVYPGVDRHFKPANRVAAGEYLSEKYGVSPPFVLTVGVIQPRKNLRTLIEGFAKLKASEDLDHKLVVVGKYGWKEETLAQCIEELGLSSEVLFVGYVPHEDLPAFYNAAEVFVYPSVYEGFGFPPLEAMACGTPVITGNRSSLPEVVGDAGIMVDPYEPEAFALAMWNVLFSESLRKEMSEAGLRQAAKFSWEKMASDMLALYRSAVST
jgi:glycosyltransferase involved in cell wall biosynthesis